MKSQSRVRSEIIYTSSTPASSSFKSEDVCLLPRQAGSCIGHFPSYYYDAISKSCKSFIYGGCYGNRNRFMNFEDCKSTCEMGKQNGNNMAGGSIAFGDRPQVEDPNVVNWPVSAGKRDTTAVPVSTLYRYVHVFPCNLLHTIANHIYSLYHSAYG